MTRPRRPLRRRQGGFTLVEMMISLVLFSLVIAGVLSVAVAMTNGYREQRNTIGAESTSRVAMDFLADAIRSTSPAVPTGAVATPGVLGGDLENLSVTACTRGAMAVVNSQTGPDELTLVFSYGSIVTSSMSSFDPLASTSIDVVDATGLQPGDLILVSSFTHGHLVTLTSVAGNTLGFSLVCTTPTLTSTHPAGALVIRVARARFYVADLDGIPALWMDADAEGPGAAEPMAEGIEDFQVAIGFDTSGDGNLTETANGQGDEWTFNDPASPETIPAGSPRAIKLALLARSVGPTTGVATFLPPALGDRPAGTTADNFRRRVLTSTVDIRNVAGAR